MRTPIVVGMRDLLKVFSHRSAGKVLTMASGTVPSTITESGTIVNGSAMGQGMSSAKVSLRTVPTPRKPKTWVLSYRMLTTM